ncbi:MULTISPECIES: PaaI family thioesterase [Staphylococcus]|uniref:PaaI family thioesterase n=1 Tax=Staphylococcus schleiferi TaxID=1295 RepID=A0A7Z7QQQ5_STASC|nr:MULTISPECIES: PaaI family thioesterase [Staphylococcus]QGS47055.1 hotdog fold thioesterase [Mammaliicoccus fleurettii]EPD53004.1 hypothetical protein HMPREF1208_00340 [Staphylococcus sp. HGB0015]MBF1991979.1 PaaI family thioesterase [Staphylococcus schleiferi]MBF2037689.1 PaaI family thioesterase [Staphylococcus schleiferi]MBF2099641.1 PaaI family thioesterase [Staphylococcus schleiferi]
MTHLMELLEIKKVSESPGYVKLSMPVSDKVKQPFGYLHGGATMALGETACSIGSFNLLEPSQGIPVGLEMNTNHIKSAREGMIYAEARILHEGRSTHVWDIRMTNEDDELISVMRGTLAIKQIKRESV